METEKWKSIFFWYVRYKGGSVEAINSHVFYSVDKRRQAAPTGVISELNKVMKNMQAPIDVI